MKIDNLYQRFNIKAPEQIAQSQNGAQKATRQQIREEAAFRGDRVDISQTSQDIRKIEAVLKNTPEVRTDKVRAIKEQIEAGTYQVDTKKVANAMMADLLKELA